MVRCSCRCRQSALTGVAIATLSHKRIGNRYQSITKGNIMKLKSIHKTAIASSIKVVNAGNKLATEAAQNRLDVKHAVLACSTLEEQWEFVGKHLMPIWLKGFPMCKIEQTNRGSYKFVNSKTGELDNNARNFMRDRLSHTTLLAGVGNTHKGKRPDRNKTEKIAPDAQRKHALAAYKLLSVADRKWFMSQVAGL